MFFTLSPVSLDEIHTLSVGNGVTGGMCAPDLCHLCTGRNGNPYPSISMEPINKSNMKQAYKINDVAFDSLKEFGIEQKDVLRFPKEVLDRMLTGRPSPLMQFNYRRQDGQQMTFLGKIHLAQDAEGVTQARILPVYREMDNRYGLEENLVEALKKGDVVLATPENSKVEENLYLQLDRETKTLNEAKERELHLPNTIGDVEIGLAQRQQFREGKPVELEKGDTKVTVGVDLDDVTGYKVINGDMEKWKENKLIKWDMSRPDITGYWKTGENGWTYHNLVKQQRQQDIDTPAAKLHQEETVVRQQQLSTGRRMGRGM